VLQQRIPHVRKSRRNTHHGNITSAEDQGPVRQYTQSLRQVRLTSPCLFPSRHDLPRGRRPGSALRSRTLLITATRSRACRRPWTQGMTDAVAERWPASLVTSGHRVPLSSHPQDSRLLTRWRGTLKMLLRMTIRVSSQTLRLAPGALNSLPTSNGTVNAVTLGAAQWLLGATHSDALFTIGRRKWATLAPGILLGLDPRLHPTPSMPLLCRREAGRAP